MISSAGGVRFRNVKGEFLAANLDWSQTPSSEQMFTAEQQGEFQAFRSQSGEYLSLKDDGSLEMVTVIDTILEDAQLFQGNKGKR